jgi:hypothetical protein
MAIWYIFGVIWHFFLVLVFCTKKNLAILTPATTSHARRCDDVKKRAIKKREMRQSSVARSG